MTEKLKAYLANNNKSYIKYKNPRVLEKLFFEHVVPSTNNPSLLNYIALYYEINNKISLALKYYERSMKLNYKYSFTNHGTLCLKINDLEKAIESFSRGATIGCVLSMKKLTDIYEKKGDTVNKLKYLHAIFDSKTTKKIKSDAAFLIGKHYETFNDFDKMKKYYRIAFKKGSSNAGVSLIIQAIKNNDEKTKEKYTRLMIKQKMYGLSLVANYYRDTLDYKNMEKYYRLSIHKGDNTGILGFARYLEKENKEKEMIDFLAEYSKDHFVAIILYGNYYSNKKDYQKAIEIYKLSGANNNALLNNNIGVCYHLMSDKKQAEYYLKLASDHHYTVATSNLGMHYLQSTNQPEKAIACFEKYKCSYSLNNLGFYYWSRNEKDKAEYYFQQSVDKKNNVAIQNLFSCYSNKKDYDNLEKFLSSHKLFQSELPIYSIISGRVEFAPDIEPIRDLFNHYAEKRLFNKILDIVQQMLHVECYVVNCIPFSKLPKDMLTTLIDKYYHLIKNRGITEIEKATEKITNIEWNVCCDINIKPFHKQNLKIFSCECNYISL